MEWLIEPLEAIWREIVLELSGPEFYLQLGVVVLAIIAGWVVANYVARHVGIFRDEPR